jgi:hypothetical protein
MLAHQKIISERMAKKYPRQRVKSLRGYAVEMIGREDARKMIEEYEWLGTFGKSTTFIGLVSPERELHGVACFGWGPGGYIRKKIGARQHQNDDGELALCLERGACVHYAPPNAASFLINGACRLICRCTSTSIFFAYADPMAGEYGGVYQAAGWSYLGQGLMGVKKKKDENGNIKELKVIQRPRRIFVLAPGLDPNNHTNWQTSRVLRQGGRDLGFDEARKLGWTIASREAKHVYATSFGQRRKQWCKEHPSLDYPAPRPELKLRTNKVFRVAAPVPPQYSIFDNELYIS